MNIEPTYNCCNFIIQTSEECTEQVIDNELVNACASQLGRLQGLVESLVLGYISNLVKECICSHSLLHKGNKVLLAQAGNCVTEGEKTR